MKRGGGGVGGGRRQGLWESLRPCRLQPEDTSLHSSSVVGASAGSCQVSAHAGAEGSWAGTGPGAVVGGGLPGGLDCLLQLSCIHQ